ncbi:unnamed protein product [Effrenium voratum]|uniref:Pentatricopeptide repeat-containing protein, chloroplastic n=1 Tax=Effrenium voratum TaxID=2562239 RepID=A0AA36JCU5_9DINO|nr:unnamed protein product [Effrenium voratum]
MAGQSILGPKPPIRLAKTASLAFRTAQIAAAGRRAQWAKALILLEDLEDRSNRLTDTHGFQVNDRDLGRADRICFNAAITACGAAARWPEALELLRRSETCEGNCNFGLNAAINACGRASLWVAALHTLKRYLGKNSRLRADVVTFNTTLTAFCHAVKWQCSLGLLQTLRPNQTNQTTQTILLSTFVRASKWRLAIAFSSTRESHLPHINATLEAYRCASLWEAALSLWQRVVRSGQADTITYSTTVSACADAWQWRKALHVFASASVSDPALAGAAVKACEKASHWKGALAVLEALQLERLEPNSANFGAAIGACEAAARWRCALSLLAQSANATVGLPSSIPLAATASAMVYATKWEDALCILHGHAFDSAVESVALRACAKGLAWRLALDMGKGLLGAEVHNPWLLADADASEPARQKKMSTASGWPV